jgi:hypothetical protein
VPLPDLRSADRSLVAAVLAGEFAVLAGALSREHPFCDEFFEEAKRLADASLTGRWLGGFFPKALGEKS